MINVKNKGKIDNYVYDISLDGTVVNALGCNICSNTDGFNFQLPQKFRYTKDNPYIGKGLSRETKNGVAYTGFEADVAEFNDKFMCDRHYSPIATNKMGLGIDEVLTSSINVSRKNYLDYFPEKPYPYDIKKVGNTLKSKKMPAYIETFLDKACRMLLKNEGQNFLEEYYDYVEKIFNCDVPLKNIASRGKVKKTKEEYIADCQTLTAAGRPKSRQAWMELAIRDNIKVDVGDTLYYINIGKTKSQADCKKVTKYVGYPEGSLNIEKSDLTNKLDKEFKTIKKDCTAKGIECPYTNLDDFVKKKYPLVEKTEEIILNCVLIPKEIIESDDINVNVGNINYNVVKYLDAFNKRVKALLVCFSKDIRDRIIVTNPGDRPYFTEEESRLVSGEPNKPGDQDTYEQLMTMEDKEIKFWAAHPEFEIPFLKECHMDWNKIYQDYLDRQERDRQLGIDKVREAFYAAVNKMSNEDLNDFLDEGTLPASVSKLVDYDPNLNAFVSPNFPDIAIATINDIIETLTNTSENETEDEMEEEII